MVRSLFRAMRNGLLGAAIGGAFWATIDPVSMIRGVLYFSDRGAEALLLGPSVAIAAGAAIGIAAAGVAGRSTCWGAFAHLTLCPTRARLRALVCLVVGIGAARWSYYWPILSRERAAVVAIRRLGGAVPEAPFTVRSVNLSGVPLHDHELLCLEALADLKNLLLRETPISDEALSPIARLTNLHTLNLGRTQVTNAGLPRLAGLRQLRVLNLGGTLIGDDGLRWLAKLTELRRLALARTRIGDAGIRILCEFPALEDLDISHTDVTDEGLAELVGCRKLKRLSLEGTKVTAEGLHGFRIQRPDVRLVHSAWFEVSTLCWLDGG